MSVLRLSATSIALSLLATALVGCARRGPTEAQKDAPTAVPVQTVSAEAADVPRTTTQPATVQAFSRAEVRARVSGYVGQVAADIGDLVEAGATLAVIEVPEMHKQREITAARLSRCEAEEARAQAGVQLAEANVRAAEAQLSQTQSEMKRTDALVAAMQAEFTRTQDLVQRQSLESRVLDEIRKKRDSELANKDAMACAIDSAAAEVIVAQAKVASAYADLKAAQADTTVGRRQLEEIDVRIEYATLKAPFAGLVTQRRVDVGDLVREASDVGDGRSLFVVSQIDTVRVQVLVPEADAALVSGGDAMSLRFPSFPGEEPIQAEVTRLANDIDPNTRTMLVEAQIENAQRKLIPGMFGEASIVLSTTAAATMLPARAVRYEESGDAFVYIVEDDATVTVAPVTTGLDDGHAIQILTGLRPGQLVVDAHLKRFVNGQQVAPLSP